MVRVRDPSLAKHVGVVALHDPNPTEGTKSTKADLLTTQPCESVTVTLYDPLVRPVMDDVVAKLFHRYV